MLSSPKAAATASLILSAARVVLVLARTILTISLRFIVAPSNREAAKVEQTLDGFR